MCRLNTVLSLFIALSANAGCRGGGGDGDGDGDVDADADSDGDGDGDLDGGDDADADDGGWPEACPGVDLNVDGVLDLDLRAVRVSGNVTLRGGSLPSVSMDRGSLIFSGNETGAAFNVNLESSGAVSYEVVIPPDTYQVTYNANPSLCTAEPTSGMPCVGGVVIEGALLMNDGVLDVDIVGPTGSLVHVTGAVTVNSQAVPNTTGDRGYLVFTGESTSFTTAPFGATGTVTYEVDVVPGQYDVSYAANPSLCNGITPPGVPCTGGVVAEGASLTSDGVFDVDISAVDITGSVTVEEQSLPSTSGDRGSLSFTSDTGALTLPSLGSSGAASYAVTLAPGSYGITYNANSLLCDGNTAPPVPCVGGPVVTGANFTSDGVYDVDMQLAVVSGVVTVNGNTPSDETAARGSITFSHESGESVSFTMEDSGEEMYELALLSGRYDISYEPTYTMCSGPTVPSVPCIGGPITSGVSLTADGVLDIDIPRVRVSGAITLNGESFPAHSDERGHLAFTNEEGGFVETQPSGASGSVSYELSLLSGSYDVMWISNPSLCEWETPEAPCMDGSLREDVSLNTDGVLDVDVLSVQVEGEVTMNGEPMPDALGDRGRLVFRLEDGGAVESGSLESTGPVAYSLSIFPGSYDIALAANASLCDGLEAPPVPCVGADLLSGVSLTSSGALDIDVQAVAVSGAVRVNDETMADESGDRGALSITAREGESIYLPSFGSTGPVTYGVTLVSGTYVFRHVANSSLCEAPRPSGRGVVPCADQWAAGCDRP